MTRKWPSYLVIHFLELYEQRPCLWDHKSPLYKNRNLREEALQEIVEAMSEYVRNFDVNMAKAKIRSLRNAYMLELHKVWRSNRNAESPDDIYTPTVPWFPIADRFLKYVVETREPRSPQELGDGEGKPMPQEGSTLDASFFAEAALGSSSVRSPAVPNGASREDPLEAARKRKISLQREELPKKLKLVNISDTVSKAVSSLHRAVDAMQQATARGGGASAPCDESEAFGRVVAAHLRALPVATALDCQADILNYLLEQRRSALPGAAGAAAPGSST
ncbi:uncharacterized protein LOC124720048 [Schistocerca piceifrons]|uniref:uncharacterized protein LOC124720048 n=1 Tax=Schistocerca piceifrons TaxID=274613 RepID=UPI001F5FB47E|nr:uncharacterized protein LOC124720048 [Schistocerca piceifrons]